MLHARIARFDVMATVALFENLVLEVNVATLIVYIRIADPESFVWSDQRPNPLRLAVKLVHSLSPISRNWIQSLPPGPNILSGEATTPIP